MCIPFAISRKRRYPATWSTIFPGAWPAAPCSNASRARASGTTYPYQDIPRPNYRQRCILEKQLLRPAAAVSPDCFHGNPSLATILPRCRRLGEVAQRRLAAHCRPFGTCRADGSRHVRHGHPVWMQVSIGAAIPKFIHSLRGFEQPPFHAAKVRNVSKVGSQLSFAI